MLSVRKQENLQSATLNLTLSVLFFFFSTSFQTVVLGFLGSTPRIMRKYEKLYTTLGFETMGVIPSFKSVFLGHLGFRGNGSRQVRSFCDILEVRVLAVFVSVPVSVVHNIPPRESA